MKHRSLTAKEFLAEKKPGNPVESREETMTKKEAGQGRQHRATYSRDKMKGGYVVRVEGPHAARFAGRVIPVTRKDGSESEEKLDALLWTGSDQGTHKPVALYTFEARPRGEEVEDLPF